MTDRHRTARHIMAISETDFIEFQALVKKLEKKTGVPDLKYKQAFKLVLIAARDKLGLTSNPDSTKAGKKSKQMPLQYILGNSLYNQGITSHIQGVMANAI